ncbi:putative 26S proteasome regulatory subunit [Apophysomyces sp. BC1034]|nr:putative 26S proteasome regulatory subunit [Apophysomyces sp. BC1015]KAG0179676.1 putative 26S proteasome regulatory subunit [Apophysomyces sp. BC1021]KAG0190167.1 putative 26S proteasome regulatory subunit [Apophysomyces sp. BC1034]
MLHHLIQDDAGHRHCNHCPLFTENTSISQAQKLVDEIEHIYLDLATWTSLKPNSHVNALFTRLVQLCVLQYGQDVTNRVLRHPSIQALTGPLRAICSSGEYLLEWHWAEKLVSLCNEGVVDPLPQFVYYNNYVGLSRLELHALEGVGATLTRVVFLGSGPLPLSSILMAQQCSKIRHIDNIDNNRQAIAISAQLIQSLGMADRLKFHEVDAGKFAGYAEADVVIMGALVGDGQQKMEFLKRIGKQMKPGAVVMVRSAHSLRKLLYPSVDAFDVNACGFETLAEVHPHNDVVNSVLIASRR